MVWSESLRSDLRSQQLCCCQWSGHSRADPLPRRCVIDISDPNYIAVRRSDFDRLVAALNDHTKPGSVNVNHVYVAASDLVNHVEYDQFITAQRAEFDYDEYVTDTIKHLAQHAPVPDASEERAGDSG